jgi:hypothetical protein
VSIGAIATIIGTLLVIAVLAVAGRAEYKKRTMRTSFGPEYDRIVLEQGGTRAADREVLRRRRLHAELSLTPLGPDDVHYYREAWAHVQGGFLDDPATALAGAEQLIGTVLDARGYPGGDQDERLALLSVRHSGTLEAYREARRVGDQAKADPAAVSTEDLRNALMQFHQIFDGLLTDSGASADPRRTQETEVRS